MNKTFPIEVGQTVYVGVFRGLAATMPAEQMLVGTVSKIGRKYMFIDTGNKALRFDGTTFSFAPAETDATIPSTSCFGLKKIMPLKC